MRKILAIFILLLILSTQFLNVAQATGENDVNERVEAKKLDKKAEVLTVYLAKFNSPLQYHAQDFVDAANTYNLDWKLVAAISGVESTFGKHIPGGFNGWGWGVYGTQAIFFKSWTEAIYTISKGLRENYVNKGYTEPLTMNRIYAQSPTWGSRVVFFMNDLEKFEKEYRAENIEKIDPKKISQDDKIAAVSASPALPVIR